MTRQIGVGILGCGAVARRWYLWGLARPTPDYRVVAVADVDAGAAQAAAAEYEIEHVHRSLDELLANPAVDLVVVLTWHRDHVEHVSAALRAGKHVYTEKPLAPTSAEADALIDLAARNGVSLASAPQVMLSPRNQRVRQLIEGGAIGAVTFTRCSCSNLGPADRPGIDYDPTWFYRDGGSLSSLGIYGLSTLIWLHGTPSRIAAMQRVTLSEREIMFGPAAGERIDVTAPDNCAATFEFPDGSLALFDGSYVVANEPRYELEIQGSIGTLWVGGYGGVESVRLQSIRGQVDDVGPASALSEHWTLAWGVADQAAALNEGRPPQVSPQLARNVIAAMEAMQRSSAEGLHVQPAPAPVASVASQ